MPCIQATNSLQSHPPPFCATPYNTTATNAATPTTPTTDTPILPAAFGPRVLVGNPVGNSVGKLLPPELNVGVNPNDDTLALVSSESPESLERVGISFDPPSLFPSSSSLLRWVVVGVAREDEEEIVRRMRDVVVISGSSSPPEPDPEPPEPEPEPVQVRPLRQQPPGTQ